MNIGIIVHSQTGHTYSVAEKLKKKLLTAGHFANIEKVISIGAVKPGDKNVRLEKLPDIGGYDALIFGAPVMGFSLSPVMSVYLPQLQSLDGKKVAGFVTMFFPFPWMGGKNAINQMGQLCNTKGTKLRETGIVNWSSRKREKQITKVVENMSKLF